MDTKLLVAVLANGKPIRNHDKLVMKWGKVSLMFVGGLISGTVVLALNFKAYKKVVRITDKWVAEKMYTIRGIKNVPF